MRISKINQINYVNFKKPQNTAARYVQSGFDSFTRNKAKTDIEKAIELHNLIGNKVEKPAVIVKEFMQYTGDDYEAAKIIASSIKEDKNGLHFNLSKENKQKIKMLEPECPYIQWYLETI